MKFSANTVNLDERILRLDGLLSEKTRKSDSKIGSGRFEIRNARLAQEARMLPTSKVSGSDLVPRVSACLIVYYANVLRALF